jgi:aminoglycoside phosphotransferase (APT) family kinase protein
MHVDEVDIDVDLVARLVAEQFPDWAARPLEPVLPRGTDNALYRLGDDLVARLPRTPRTSRALELERRWLPTLAPHLPLAVPVPLADGRPAHGYPFTWSVYGWLPGQTATHAPVADQEQLAADLAHFIDALRRIDPTGGPPPGAVNASRGVPLATRDRSTRDSIAKLEETIDTDAVTAAWETALAASVWERPGVWLHGDLDARNLLVHNGRLSAVIDFGCLSVGDPACDVMAAWKLLSLSGRDVFRAALDVDDATWARGRGWALSQAVNALSYYTLETNAVLVHEARRWLAAVLEDHATAA